MASAVWSEARGFECSSLPGVERAMVLNRVIQPCGIDYAIGFCCSSFEDLTPVFERFRGNPHDAPSLLCLSMR